jgi:hypothetical protein
MSEPSTLFDDLRASVALSRRSLAKVGDSDWTPQDSVHLHLVQMVEKFLAASNGLSRQEARRG